MIVERLNSNGNIVSVTHSTWENVWGQCSGGDPGSGYSSGTGTGGAGGGGTTEREARQRTEDVRACIQSGLDALGPVGELLKAAGITSVTLVGVGSAMVSASAADYSALMQRLGTLITVATPKIGAATELQAGVGNFLEGVIARATYAPALEGVSAGSTVVTVGAYGFTAVGGFLLGYVGTLAVSCNLSPN